jgi:hypothetical protein
MSLVELRQVQRRCGSKIRLQSTDTILASAVLYVRLLVNERLQVAGSLFLCRTVCPPIFVLRCGELGGAVCKFEARAAVNDQVHEMLLQVLSWSDGVGCSSAAVESF